jgi:hypothetical protein
LEWKKQNSLSKRPVKNPVTAVEKAASRNIQNSTDNINVNIEAIEIVNLNAGLQRGQSLYGSIQ